MRARASPRRTPRSANEHACGRARLPRPARRPRAASADARLRAARCVRERRRRSRRRRARHRRLGARARSRCAPRSARRSGTCSTTRRAAACRACTCSTTSIRPTSRRCSARLDLRAHAVRRDSKSGGTAETMAQYLVIRARLNGALGDAGARERLVLRHRSGEGRAARHRARAKASRRSTFPPNVGGRFSVLTPVGHASGRADRHRHRRSCSPARRDMRDALRVERARRRTRRRLRARCSASPTRQHGRHVQVLMPYSDALRDIAAWFVQLWAESLGKHRDAGRRRRRPDAARRARRHRPAQPGAAVHGGAGRQDGDLHRASTEVEGGRRDPAPARRHPRARVPRRPPARRAARHRAARDGRRARAPRPAEHDAHARPRGRRGTSARCSCSSSWRPPTPGALYGVNAFDQPGVELGKQFTYAMLGRAGRRRGAARVGPAARSPIRGGFV